MLFSGLEAYAQNSAVSVKDSVVNNTQQNLSVKKIRRLRLIFTDLFVMIFLLILDKILEQVKM